MQLPLELLHRILSHVSARGLHLLVKHDEGWLSKNDLRRLVLYRAASELVVLYGPFAGGRFRYSCTAYIVFLIDRITDILILRTEKLPCSYPLTFTRCIDDQLISDVDWKAVSKTHRRSKRRIERIASKAMELIMEVLQPYVERRTYHDSFPDNVKTYIANKLTLYFSSA